MSAMVRATRRILSWERAENPNRPAARVVVPLDDEHLGRRIQDRVTRLAVSL